MKIKLGFLQRAVIRKVITLAQYKEVLEDNLEPKRVKKILYKLVTSDKLKL